MSGVPSPTVKRLFAVSGNQCSFPKCALPLVDAQSGKVTGKICHIKARNKNGPRYDHLQPEEERHEFSNLILMCPIHHDVIDSDEKSYTVERLLEIKDEHEKKDHKEQEPKDDIALQFIQNIELNLNRSIFSIENQIGGQIAHEINNYYLSPQQDIHVKPLELQFSNEDQKLLGTEINLSAEFVEPIEKSYFFSRVTLKNLGISENSLDKRIRFSGYNFLYSSESNWESYLIKAIKEEEDYKKREVSAKVFYEEEENYFEDVCSYISQQKRLCKVRFFLKNNVPTKMDNVTIKICIKKSNSIDLYDNYTLPEEPTGGSIPDIIKSYPMDTTVESKKNFWEVNIQFPTIRPKETIFSEGTLYICPSKTCYLIWEARIYGDEFEPFDIPLMIHIDLSRRVIDIDELISFGSK